MDKDTEVIRMHSFQHGARSIIQMGEELIGHPSTAINELVKNSYDADALSSYVYFYYNEDSPKSFAIIYDDGNGMNENILFGDWLHPSVSEKRKLGARSKIYQRHVLGSKGIGRLASMALGRYTTVVTKQEDEQEYNWITVDRDLFKKEGVLLTNIKFPGDKIKEIIDVFSRDIITETRQVPINNALINILKNNNLASFSKGTLIIIEHLDEAVTKIITQDFFGQIDIFSDSIKTTKFYESLAKLVTPLNIGSDIQKDLKDKSIIKEEISLASNKNTFTVNFGINLLPDQVNNRIEWQKIEDIPILSVFDYRILGKVKRDGSVDGYMFYQRLQNDKFEEKIEIGGLETITDELNNDKEINNINLNRQLIEIGEYYFDIRIYDIGEKDNLEKLAKQAGFDSSSSFKKAFKKFQGLRVSKNGFGVKPYGDEVEDWIDLSRERVQDPGHNVNTNQILGYVLFYSPENDNLMEKTNREGFIENTAFIEVKDTLKDIFRYVGRKRYNYRLMNGLGRIPRRRYTKPDLQNFIDEINKTDDLSHIRQYSEQVIHDVTTSMDNLEELLTFSERLASLGKGIELVYHEMAQPISQLKTTQASLNLKKSKIPQEIKPAFLDDIDSLNTSTKVLIELRESLQPAIGKSRKKRFNPFNTFNKVCSLYKDDFNKFQIISPDPDNESIQFEIYSYEYAFWIAFLNIINNAVYWLKKSGRPGEIRFNVKNGNIIISNSGPLINEKIIDYIFVYGVTTRQEKNATGLGLSFTRSILGRINWTITAENRNDGPTFIISEGTNG